MAEADRLALALRGRGVRVCQVEDIPSRRLPDAVFPNNWVSFHRDGSVVLYPMMSPVRRAERRLDLVEQVCEELGFDFRRRVDLTANEDSGRYLEGTGSLVLDHVHRIAYACRSPRTDERLVLEWCDTMGYQPVVFDAATEDGVPVYHTNVLLWIGSTACGVGSDWIAPRDRGRILDALSASGRRPFEIAPAALYRFAGNMIELRGSLGPVLIMSEAAARALGDATTSALETQVGSLLCVAVPTIERLGGGSVRCMIAEVPL